MDLMVLIIGFCMTVWSMIVSTNGSITSKILFKVIPFFSGMYLIIYYMVERGMINV